MAVLHAPSSPPVIRRRVPIGVVALAVLACAKDAPLDSGETPPSSLGRCNPDSMLSWSGVEPLFEEHCTDCHSSDNMGSTRQGAPAGIDYNTAESSRLNSDRTWQMIVTEQMPLQDPVPHEDAWLFWEWLSCGGPE
ncbi:MAG: hypothetical protein VXW32_05495 [Myxococcota bacterium]|nr:hypothetical protein [Myxococcota bacterium]